MNLIKILQSSLFIFILFFAFSFASQNANANTLWESQEGFGGTNEIGSKFGDGSGNPTSIKIVILRVIRIFLEFLGIIFLIITLLSGYKYMTSGGSEDKTSEALKGIKNGIIGLLIILCAFAITNLITTCAIDATSISPSAPWYCKMP
jgi:di/tricarboxylate transporter